MDAAFPCGPTAHLADETKGGRVGASGCEDNDSFQVDTAFPGGPKAPCQCHRQCCPGEGLVSLDRQWNKHFQAGQRHLVNAIGNVVQDAAREQHRLLAHKKDKDSKND